MLKDCSWRHKKRCGNYTLACPTTRGSCMPNTIERASIEPTMICTQFLLNTPRRKEWMHNHITWASTPCHVQDRVESCKISSWPEQSVNVNAFLICRDPQVAVSARDLQLLFTQRVGGKVRNYFRNFQIFRQLFLIGAAKRVALDLIACHRRDARIWKNAENMYPSTMDGLKHWCRKGL